MNEFKLEYTAALFKAIQRLNWNYGKGDISQVTNPQNGKGTYVQTIYGASAGKTMRYSVVIKADNRTLTVYALGHQLTVGV